MVACTAHLARHAGRIWRCRPCWLGSTGSEPWRDQRKLKDLDVAERQLNIQREQTNPTFMVTQDPPNCDDELDDEEEDAELQSARRVVTTLITCEVEMLSRLWTGWRRLVESEYWVWNWRVVVTHINSAVIRNRVMWSIDIVTVGVSSGCMVNLFLGGDMLQLAYYGTEGDEQALTVAVDFDGR